MRYFVDIDDTLTYTPLGDYENAVPRMDRICRINALYDRGNTIICWTGRGTVTGVDWRPKTEQQLTSWGLKYHELLLGKPDYDIFIDDKSLNSEVWATDVPLSQRSLYITTCRRCGTHWLKNIVSGVFGWGFDLPDMEPFRDSKARSYEYPRAVLARELEEGGNRVYVSHTPLNLLGFLSKHVNVVVLVRDLRDSCVSNSFYSLKEEEFSEEKFENNLREYLSSGGPSPDFNESYITDQGLIPHYLMRFEDLVTNPFSSVLRMLSHFKYDFEVGNLSEAVSNNSFKKLSGGRDIGKEDPRSHYRKGVIGEWKKYCTKEDEQIFWEKRGELMGLWGYNR